MDNDNVDEDSIDTMALQAQIDLSMAFAQNLVSSWIKPSRKIPIRSNVDMEAELKDYMRRPPRLGVGAPIPETQSLTRETARLKGKLLGKGSKRPREEENVVSKEKSDEEEESRAGAIKKKPRVDPFGQGKWKKSKKNKKMPDGPSMHAHPEPTQPDKAGSDEVGETTPETELEEGKSPATPSRKKKRNHKSDGIAAAPSSPPPISLSKRPIDETATKAILVDTTSSEPRLRVADISLVSTPIIYSRFQRSSQSADILKQPILNLASPESGEDSDDPSKLGSNNDSPKKKRKRRKKKKKGRLAVDGRTGASAS